MHMRMRSATPSVYLDLWEGRVEQKKTAVRKRATPQVIFSNKELQPIPTMYF